MGASDDAIVVVEMSAASARSLQPQLTRIDSRLGTIDGRLETRDERFVAIAGRLETTDGRLVAIDGRLETTDGRFVGIEGRLGTFDGRFVAIEERLDTNDVRFDRVVIQEEFDRRVATLATRQEWKAARLGDRAEMRRHFLMLSKDFRTQVQIIAEGHAG